MVDFRYNNNAIRNQKHFKPIANGNVTDSRMIALTDESLPYWKPKKEWKFKCKSWTKKLINCLFSQIKTKHKSTAYLMYLCYFFHYLQKYLNRYCANQLDILITTSTKTTIFTATQLKHIWHTTISKAKTSHSHGFSVRNIRAALIWI